MDYTVGSVADLILGSKTPNKVKVVQMVAEKSPKNDIIDDDTPQLKKQKKSLKVAKKKKTEIKSVVVKTKKLSKDELLENESDEEEEDKNGCDSSGDSDDEITVKVNSPTLKLDKNTKPLKSRKAEAKEETQSQHNDRTVFVGNLPLNVNKLRLKKLFEKYGKVESVRLRGIPVADPRVPKKVAMIKKQFHKDRTSFHGYVRFEKRENALKAIELNGYDFKGHHLRVNICDLATKPDQNKAIFLGNVSFEAEEEELWKLFESCGAIESVRLVRDRQTNVGKGFGYINFKSSDSVELALQMEKVMLKKRELRIAACDAKKSKSKVESTCKNPVEKVGKPPLHQAIQQLKGNSSFQGKKVALKKKKKFDKGAYQKKALAKKIAPLGAS